jgi:hypothetical protein
MSPKQEREERDRRSRGYNVSLEFKKSLDEDKWSSAQDIIRFLPLKARCWPSFGYDFTGPKPMAPPEKRPVPLEIVKVEVGFDPRNSRYNDANADETPVLYRNKSIFLHIDAKGGWRYCDSIGNAPLESTIRLDQPYCNDPAKLDELAIEIGKRVQQWEKEEEARYQKELYSWKLQVVNWEMEFVEREWKLGNISIFPPGTEQKDIDAAVEFGHSLFSKMFYGDNKLSNPFGGKLEFPSRPQIIQVVRDHTDGKVKVLLGGGEAGEECGERDSTHKRKRSIGTSNAGPGKPKEILLDIKDVKKALELTDEHIAKHTNSPYQPWDGGEVEVYSKRYFNHVLQELDTHGDPSKIKANILFPDPLVDVIPPGPNVIAPILDLSDVEPKE